MHVNLDELAPLVPAWDLTFTVDGRQYATRELTQADVEELLRIAESGDGGAAIAALKGLFVGEAPAVEQWDAARTIIFLGVLIDYATRRLLGVLAAASRTADAVCGRGNGGGNLN